MKAIGIDLGEDSVKIVELVQNKKNLTIQSISEKKLSAQGSGHDKELETIEFLRGVFGKTDTTQVTFVMAIRQEKATIRKKTFPFSDRIKIQKSLSFEMEEDIPFDPDMCIFDFKTIQYIGNSSETLSIAIPKTHIEKIISLAKDFGIELKIVTLEGFAFANLIEDWWVAPPVAQDSLISIAEGEVKSQKAAEIFLNIGHKKTVLCAKINNRMVFTRSLMWGADFIIQDLVKRYQLPYIEAQKMLQTSASLSLNKAELNFEQANVAALIEKSLRDLVRDLQMSFLEIESELNSSIATVYFTGGFSQLPHLGAYLTQQLEVACNPVNLMGHYMQAPINTSIPENKIIAQFGTALGIAIEAFKKPKNPALQFLKGDFINQNGFVKAFWNDWGKLLQVSAAALVVLFSWAYFRESFTLDLNDKGTEAISSKAKSVAKLPRKQANEKGVKKYITEHKKQAQEMKALNQLSTMNSAMDVLKKISDSSPDKEQSKIDVTHLSIIDDTVKISGYANSPREVTLLSTKLTALSSNNKVSEEPTNLGVVPNRVSFSLSFKTDRGIVK
jgi:general secretion pathway protein L